MGNKEHPTQLLKAGDQIVGVNGVTGDAKRMMARCKTDQILRLIVKSSSSEMAHASNLDSNPGPLPPFSEDRAEAPHDSTHDAGTEHRPTKESSKTNGGDASGGVDQNTVSQLVHMGYEKEKVSAALASTGNDV